MFLIVFLILLNLFKVAAAPYFPLIGDEAFYWLWSQHLDLSYIAHPPMVAYVNFILTALFGQNEFAIRLGVILILLLISGIIYLTGKELYGPAAAGTAVVVFNLLPTFWGGGMFLVPQTVLFLFWALSFYLLALIIKRQKPHYWYFLGISAGLGLLSDYVMALFFIGAVLFFLLVREQRFWFARKEPYLAVLLSLIVFSPVIIWNLRLGFAPFLYWGGKMGSDIRIADNLLNFFGLQMILYTPPIFIMTVYLALIKWWKKVEPETESLGSIDPRNREFYSQVPKLFSLLSAVVFLPFAVISPILNVGGHWPATAYLPAILSTDRARKMTLSLIIFFALLVNILGFTYYIFLYPTPAELKGREFTINQQLPQFIKASTPKKGRTFYIANDIGTIGLVSFHGRVRVYSPPGRIRQMDMWGAPDIKKGDNVIYFAREHTPQLHKELKPLFSRVWIEPEKRIFAKDADIPTRMQIFHCRGFRGGQLP